MRTARKKVIGKSCYYHACARIAGLKNDYLFTDVDKEHGMKIVCELSKLYLVEVISMCWMGNHWHIVFYVPSPEKRPSLDKICTRYNRFYKGKVSTELNPEINLERCEQIADQLFDISFFMRQIHQKFTYYINRVHNRRGTLWAERFKSSILDGRSALLTCVKYLELNPVRAKLVEDAADYRFSTWGNYCGSGKHLFEANFIKHIRKNLGERAKKWTKEEVFAEFRGEIARTITYESGSKEDPLLAKRRAIKKESMPIRCLRRTRHWTDGGIIGTKAFIQETALQFYEKKRVMKKRISSGLDRNGQELCCYKQLRL